MENPATWNSIQKLINKVLQEIWENDQKPPEEQVIGFSHATQIYNALKKAGYLNEPKS